MYRLWDRFSTPLQTEIPHMDISASLGQTVRFPLAVATLRLEYAQLQQPHALTLMSLCASGSLEDLPRSPSPHPLPTSLPFLVVSASLGFICLRPSQVLCLQGKMSLQGGFNELILIPA